MVEGFNPAFAELCNIRRLPTAATEPVVQPQHPVDADAQNVTYLRKRNRKVEGSEAFNLNYDAVPTRSELRRDIISYLGEYRLQVQKHKYELIYGRDRNHRGDITIRDVDRGDSALNMAKRAVEERTAKKQPKHREEAEEKGLHSLNEQMRFAQPGDTVIWASPPGPKDQGYGDYGFIFAGKVSQLDNGEKKLSMTAIRVEKPKKEGVQGDPWVAQSAKVINALSDATIAFQTKEDLLATPMLIRKDIPEAKIDGILQKAFDFTPSEKDKERMQAIISRMDPLIDQFITLMYTGTTEERIKAFHALENYALDLKEKYSEREEENVVYREEPKKEPTLSDIVKTHGHKPPTVAGSCGATGAQSNGLVIMGGSGLVDMIYSPDQYEGRTFTCNECGKINVRPSGKLLSKCEVCSSKKVAC